MWSLAVLFIIFSTQGILPSVRAGYKFEMLLVGYQNPTHKDRNGAFCERSNGNNACDNAFIICIRRRNSHDCDFERLETNKIEEDNDNLMFSEGEPVGRIDNPIAISGDIWPGEIEIELHVYDLDGQGTSIDYGSDHITTFIIHPDVTATTNGSFTEEKDYESDHSSLQMAFRLTCLPPHFGLNCSQLCNDSSVPCPYRVAPTSTDPVVSSTVEPATDTITVDQPSKDQAPSLPVISVIICIGGVILLAIIIVVIALVILKMKRRKRRAIDIHAIDDSAFKMPQDSDITGNACKDHLYETPSSWRTSSTPSAPPPTFAAVNVMYHIAQEDPDGMTMEKNISYARVNVERNVAYGVVGEQRFQHHPMIPLPGLQ